MIDEDKIRAAETSLQTMLGVETLSNRSFLDAGSGSGLFSLAARRLGAAPVVSFDFDVDSVACTQLTREKFEGADSDWTVMQGDLLNQTWLADLGQFDIVYSWGVLHHTGNMWQAIENVCGLVKPGGTLFISIYNDQGWISRAWVRVKQAYNRGGLSTRLVLLALYMGLFYSVRTVWGIRRLESPRIWYQSSARGMTVWHDAVDWIGGYPFETATPEEIETFLAKRGFRTVRSTIKSGSGCNEFVLERVS